MSHNGVRKESTKLPVRRESAKLPVCDDQTLFDADMNSSDIIFNSGLPPPNNDNLFSALGLTSKKEFMESPAPGESPSMDARAGNFESGSFTFVSGEEKTIPSVAVKRKRKHPSEDEHDEVKAQLFAAMENNSRALAAYVESQNLNSQMDRTRRKEQSEHLVAVLGNLANALERVAERL